MGKPKIFIVDDEEKNIRLLEGMLYNEDYQTSAAHKGEDALQKVTDISPDLILLDVMMPGIDGFEVCRRLKAAEETKMIPIVMITALRDKTHRIKAMESSADDFLSKPVDRTELLIRIKSLLRIKTYHDELFARYKEIAGKNEMLLRLEKTKEGLIQMIVHDLRSPVAALIGYIEFILLNKNNFSQSQLDSLEKSLTSCLELKDMIQALLDINKMEEGKLTLEKKSTDLVKLIHATVDQFDQRAKEN